jgi:hypothetical protein
MISCASCQAELPDTAAFCLSCGQVIETNTDVKGPSEVDREWLMEVFTGVGYDCEESETSSNRFCASDSVRTDLVPNLTVTLHPQERAITLVSVWRLQRSRRDEAQLHAALNEFNGLVPFWAAWTIDETTLGISTVFTLGLRTSRRTMEAFLERATDLLFKQLAVAPALDRFLGFVLSARSAQQLSPFRGH